MSKITKTYKPEVKALNDQIDNIVANQFGNNKRVTITFPDGTTEMQARVGFLADRFIVVDRDAAINIYRTKSDSEFAYFKASGAGTATLMVWKEE